MEHQGSRQVGGYRSSSDKPFRARSSHTRGPRNYSSDFYAAINELRSALWADDIERITRLERRIDHIVSEWDAVGRSGAQQTRAGSAVVPTSSRGHATVESARRSEDLG